ncbi:DDE_3 domain-containing protein [Trichonephila clavipes]|nr:DDE_3 domain-containing protein [Trichonephila clavipes]
MTGHIYRDVILEQHVRLFRGAMGAEFLFMDDNARPHRANIIDECLQPEDITRMDWPAYLPDLNPIEHVWNMVGRRIATRQPPPTCLPELRKALLDEWCNIPQDQIDNLILSMPRRYTPTLNFYNSGTANREVTHSMLPTNHSACFHLPVHSKLPLVFLLRLSRHPPSYALPPRHLLRHSASQSGSFMLPIMVLPLHQATFTLHVMGRRNASRSMSQ